VLVRLKHCASGIFLWPAGRPADHFSDEIFEPRRWHSVVGFVDGWVRIQPGIRHDAINKIIDDTRDAVNSAEAFVEAGFVWLCRHVSLRSWRELCRIIRHLQRRRASENVQSWRAPTGFQVIRLATRRSITKLWTNRCSAVSGTSFRRFRRTSLERRCFLGARRFLLGALSRVRRHERPLRRGSPGVNS